MYIAMTNFASPPENFFVTKNSGVSQSGNTFTQIGTTNTATISLGYHSSEPIPAGTKFTFIGNIDRRETGRYRIYFRHYTQAAPNTSIGTDIHIVDAQGVLTQAGTTGTEQWTIQGTELGNFICVLEITTECYGVVGYCSCVKYSNGSSISNVDATVTWQVLGVGNKPSDPYENLPGIGTATPGGGGGGGTEAMGISEPVDFPSLQTISVADAGFMSIWTPNLTQLQDLANFMWTADPTKIDFWKKLIANPMELILGLHLVPFNVTHETLPASVTMGFIDTGISMYYTDQQFWEIDCGSINFLECWGGFLDYAPYTTVDIFLPFIGTRTLNINDCMPKTVALKYIIDITTGTCVAIIKCGDSVMYHFNGSCAAQIPVTASQMQEIVRSAISLITSVAASAATGGVAGGAIAAVTGASSAIANTGTHAQRSGSIGGTSGFMSCLTPYIILSRPRQALPENQYEYTGYPAFITEKIGDIEGYTEIEIMHLQDMTCLAEEAEEIIRLMSEGVIC